MCNCSTLYRAWQARRRTPKQRSRVVGGRRDPPAAPRARGASTRRAARRRARAGGSPTTRAGDVGVEPGETDDERADTAPPPQRRAWARAYALHDGPTRPLAPGSPTDLHRRWWEARIKAAERGRPLDHHLRVVVEPAYEARGLPAAPPEGAVAVGVVQRRFRLVPVGPVPGCTT